MNGLNFGCPTHCRVEIWLADTKSEDLLIVQDQFNDSQFTISLSLLV